MNNIFIKHRYLYLPIFLIVMVWDTGHVFAGTWEGTVQGLNCVLYDKACPKDKADPLVAGENVFVVLTSDKHYFFVPNIARRVMARWVAKKVRITGDQNDKYNSIKAEKLEVASNGTYKTKWSQKMEDETYRDYYGRGK